jgi:hypothetical protein
MAQRNQSIGVLRRHDARQASHFEDIALGNLLLSNGSQSLGVHQNKTFGSGHSFCDGFLRDIHHPAGSLLVEMAKFVHEIIAMHEK